MKQIPVAPERNRASRRYSLPTLILFLVTERVCYDGKNPNLSNPNENKSYAALRENETTKEPFFFLIYITSILTIAYLPMY